MRLRILPALLCLLLLCACADVSAGSGSTSGGSRANDDGGSADAADVTGTWGNVDNPEEPSLNFAPDGRVNGTDGCNRLMGGWTQDGSTVTISNLASTMMFCQGVDTWLSGAATAEVEGDALRVLNPEGAELGVLHR